MSLFTLNTHVHAVPSNPYVSLFSVAGVNRWFFAWVAVAVISGFPVTVIPGVKRPAVDWATVEARQRHSFFGTAPSMARPPSGAPAQRAWESTAGGASAPPTLAVALRASTVGHPLGLHVGALIPRPPPGPRITSPADFCQRTLANAYTLAWHSVQATSRDSYATPWKHWVTWAAEFGTDRYLRTVPEFWRAAQAEFPFPFGVAAVISFVTYMFGDLLLRPSTVTSYLSGVKFMLQIANVDTRFMDENQTLRRVKSGMIQAYRTINPEYEKRTMPFTVDMIVHTAAHLDQTSVEGFMVVSAMKMAYCCLMRNSEYLWNATTKHHLQGRCVLFVHTVQGVERVVESSEAWTSGLSVDTLTEIIVDVLSAKNDADGAGHRIAFHRKALAQRSANQPFDFAEDMWAYAIRARPESAGPFFVYRGELRLSYYTFSKCIKETAVQMGLKPEFFSTHSLRVAGASALAAAGVPDYVIQIMGRWKSLVFLTYIRLASNAYNDAMTAMCDVSTLTVSDLRRITPAV